MAVTRTLNQLYQHGELIKESNWTATGGVKVQ